MVTFSTIMQAYDVPLLTKMSFLDGFGTVLCEDPNIFPHCLIWDASMSVQHNYDVI